MNTLFALIFYVGLVGIIGMFIAWMVTKALKRTDRARLFRKLFGASIGILAIGFIGYGFTGADETEKPVTKEVKEEVQPVSAKDKTKETAKDETKEEVPKEDVYKIGDSVAIDDLTYVVKGIETKQTIAGYTSESGTYLAVTVEVTNNSAKPKTVSDSDFTLKLGEAEYTNDATTTAYHEGGFLLEEINPGLSTTSSIVFEVPKEFGTAELVIKPNRFKDDIASIILE